MKELAPPLLKHLRYLTAGFALICFIASVCIHSQVISPALFVAEEEVYISHADLSIDGHLVAEDFQLPGTFWLDKGSIAGFDADIRAPEESSRYLLVLTDAASFTVTIDGVTVFDEGRSVNPYSSVHSGERPYFIIPLPDNLEFNHMNISLSRGSQNSGGFITLNAVTAGSPFAIISGLALNITFMSLIILIPLVLIVLTFLGLILQRQKRNTAYLAVLILLEITTVSLIVSSIPFKFLIYYNGNFWQVLQTLSIMIFILTVYIMFAHLDGMKCLQKTRILLLFLSPAALMTVSAILYPLSADLSHSAFLLVGPLASAVLIVTVITLWMDSRKHPDSTGFNNYHIAFCLLALCAFFTDLIHITDARSFNAMKSAKSMFLLTALLSYVCFSLASYLSRERAIIGQLELNSLLYRDALTGCSNRRKWHEMKADERIMKKRIHIVMFDLDDIKKINDSFGHSEADRVLSFFGAFMKENLPLSSSLYRIGGDEFVAHLDASADAAVIMDSIYAGYCEKAPYTSRYSWGIEMYDGSGRQEYEKALMSAEKKMYEMKRQHKASAIRTLTGGEL